MKLVALFNKKINRVVYMEESIAKVNLEVAKNIFTAEIPEEFKSEVEGTLNKGSEKITLDTEDQTGKNDLKNSNGPGTQTTPTIIKANPDPDPKLDADPNQKLDDDLVPSDKWLVPRLKEYLTLFDVPFSDSDLKTVLLSKAADYYSKNVKK